jgi:hypothetical protein
MARRAAVRDRPAFHRARCDSRRDGVRPTPGAARPPSDASATRAIRAIGSRQGAEGAEERRAASATAGTTPGRLQDARRPGIAPTVLPAPGNLGGRTRTRTLDPLIKSQLLYQLSYAPQAAHVGGFVRSVKARRNERRPHLLRAAGFGPR